MPSFNTFLNALINPILDASIYFSFDQRGYLRHQKSYFNPNDLEKDLSDLNIMITGANNGLGYETARQLAHMKANLFLVCRNPEKSEQAYQEIKKIQPNTTLIIADMSDLESIRNITIDQKIDCLVQNAGLMPETYQVSKQGYEICLATHILGPLTLIDHLKHKNLFSPKPRIIFVSSGGGYTKKLDIHQIFEPSQTTYDGMQAYAYTKRAQMVLSEMINQKNPEKIESFVCHPGWADTSGVRTAMPKFFEKTKENLRNLQSGADTIVYLASQTKEKQSTQGVWFDRKIRSYYLLPFTKESSEDREKFWQKLSEILDLSHLHYPI